MMKFVVSSLLVSAALCAVAQQPKPPAPPATLGLEHGTLDFSTPSLSLKLVKDSQTIAALSPTALPKFDFTPNDRLSVRQSNGFYHLGDITFRLKQSGTWKAYSSATKRMPVAALKATGKTLAAADLTATLPADCPLQVIRSYQVINGSLALIFDIKNKSNEAVEIGALGIPMVFNNIITDRNLEQSHETCSFSDPYIGQDAGYIQVTRLQGTGPALVVTPLGKTPLENYRVLDEPMGRWQTFEGMFEWMVHSKAYADQEWKGVEQWNRPTDETLAPGATRRIGVKFVVADSIRGIDKALEKDRRPVTVGIPGYILPQDQDGKLYIKYPSPIKSLTAEPAGAVEATLGKKQKQYQTVLVSGKTWGRSRLRITYADGTEQTVSYMVTKPAATAVADLGHFLTTKQWYTDEKDPFHRAPSIITYDREADKQVTQDSRVWISGLGDEGGTGSWLAGVMKEYGQPNPEEVAKLEQFIDKVVWGVLQFKDGDKKFGVKKSAFYYDPKGMPDFKYDEKLNWKSWTSWSKEASEDIGRGYNYPHIVAAYWSLYRVARNHPGLVKSHPWDWYLNQAFETTKFLTDKNPDGSPKVWYVDTGLMEGDIFLNMLQDLKREGWTEKASLIEARMKERTDHWISQAYPFGSEMAWDSTGQEEVHAWCTYFDRHDKALVSLNSILGYMPTVPHWGYNGNARRYWDFLYGGKLSRIERQLHHYGSGINAIPVLKEYRENPADFYLLRIGYGGAMGALSNIDQEGFASAAFHSFPSTLKWDAYTGDYGPNFFGHAYNTATYVLNHPDLGWQAFGGNLTTMKDLVSVEPKDSFRNRVYFAPVGLWLTLDAGTFDKVEFNSKTGEVKVTLSPGSENLPAARLVIEQPAKIAGVGSYHVVGSYAKDAGAATIPLAPTPTTITLSSK